MEQATIDSRAATDLQRDRTVLIKEIIVALVITVLLWIGIGYFMPAIPGMGTLAARLIFTLKLTCVAVVFCFLTGIEAVAHERLQSTGIDPLSGYTSRRTTYAGRSSAHRESADGCRAAITPRCRASGGPGRSRASPPLPH
jgi:hypothetical protein